MLVIEAWRRLRSTLSSVDERPQNGCGFACRIWINGWNASERRHVRDPETSSYLASFQMDISHRRDPLRPAARAERDGAFGACTSAWAQSREKENATAIGGRAKACSSPLAP